MSTHNNPLKQTVYLQKGELKQISKSSGVFEGMLLLNIWSKSPI